jgi:hypothetical protein
MTLIPNPIAPLLVHLSEPVVERDPASVEGDFALVYTETIDGAAQVPSTDLVWAVMPESPAVTAPTDEMQDHANAIVTGETVSLEVSEPVMSVGETMAIGAFLVLQKMAAPLVHDDLHLFSKCDGVIGQGSKPIFSQQGSVAVPVSEAMPQDFETGFPEDHGLAKPLREESLTPVQGVKKVPISAEADIRAAAEMADPGVVEEPALPLAASGEGRRMTSADRVGPVGDHLPGFSPKSPVPDSEPSRFLSLSDGQRQAQRGSQADAVEPPTIPRSTVGTKLCSVTQEMSWSFLVTDAPPETERNADRAPDHSHGRITGNGSNLPSGQMPLLNGDPVLPSVLPEGWSAVLPPGGDKSQPTQMVARPGFVAVPQEMKSRAVERLLSFQSEPEAGLKPDSGPNELVAEERAVSHTNAAHLPSSVTALSAVGDDPWPPRRLLPAELNLAELPPEVSQSRVSMTDGTATHHPFPLSLPEAGGVERSPPLSLRAEPSTPTPQAQIVAAVTTGSNQKVELLLSPEELGQVRIDMRRDAEGLVVSISAERQDTLDLLRRNAEQLIMDLRLAGQGGVSLSFGRWAGSGDHGPGHGAAPAADGGVEVREPKAASAQSSMHPTPPTAGLYLRI